MGDYTLLKFDSTLRADTPPEVIRAVRYMLERPPQPVPSDLPTHSLFRTDRWRVMLRMSSAYFDEPTRSELLQRPDGAWRLEVQCNLKNYGGEIEKFCDWIMPYTSEPEGSVLGFSRSEYADNNSVITKRSAHLTMSEPQTISESMAQSQAEEDALYAAWALGDYDSEDCPKCGRHRLCKCPNGKRRCEKCNWCPEDAAYAPVAY